MQRFKQLSLMALALALICLSMANAQPTIQGNLEGTLGPGTYIVVGDIAVQYNAELTIEPGTTFLHSGHYKWNISGTLTAEGSEAEPIVFKRQYENETCKWGGIRFISSYSNNSVLDYCTIEYCKNISYPDYYGGGIYSTGCSPTIRNTRIANCYASTGGGVYATSNSTMVLDGCTIFGNTAGNGGGIYLNSSSGVQVKNSVIAKNSSTST